MNKNNTDLTINQEKKSLNWSGNSVVIVKETASNLSPGAQDALNHFISLFNFHEEVFYSVTSIANRVGYSRGHMHRLLNELESSGCIKRKYRHMKTNLYKVNPTFFAYKVRKALQDILPALRYPAAFMMLAAFFTAQSMEQQRIRQLEERHNQLCQDYKDYVTQAREKYKYLKNNSLSTSRLVSNDPKTETKADEESKKNPIRFRTAVEQCQQYVQLTKHGKAKLAIFADEALAIACKEVQKLQNKTENDKFAYLYKVASNETKRLNRVPDWQTYKIYKQELFILSNDPVVEETTTPTKHTPPAKVFKRPTTGVYAVYRPIARPPRATAHEFSLLMQNEQVRKNLAVLGLTPQQVFAQHPQVVKNRPERKRTSILKVTYVR